MSSLGIALSGATMTVRRAAVRLAAVSLAAVSLAVAAGGCDSGRVELVAETDDDAADFGRTALINAVVTLSQTPEDPRAYARFARKVNSLRHRFNRDVERDAELRLMVLALRPLEAGIHLSAAEQMQRFATTVWPSVLDFPARTGESPDAYVKRLCGSELALTCNNVIPEEWPVILNARVWRSLKSRLFVAYDRCQWCADDPSFREILATLRNTQLKVELMANEAVERGHPSRWPKAGQHASPLATELILSFGEDGLVTIEGATALGGDWRAAIKKRRPQEPLLGLHLRPERMVSELLELLGDARDAGYEQVALVVREPAFPYQARQYRIDSATRNAKQLGVRPSDSIQILVQRLDLAASQIASGR